jgi:hypothetical protein
MIYVSLGLSDNAYLLFRKTLDGFYWALSLRIDIARIFCVTVLEILRFRCIYTEIYDLVGRYVFDKTHRPFVFF